MKKIFVLLMAAMFITSCQIVRQGEVGVKRTLGKIKPKPLQAGARFFNPFTSVIIKVPTRTVNLEVGLALPSKEGLNVGAEISILYRVDGKKATQLIENIGPNYENIVIVPVFRASSADVTAKYMAKDMHTGSRLEIEEEIRARMDELLRPRGIIVDAVLMKSIRLPSGLARAIEEKLEAEQDAQRMEFILQRESQEAERKRIEAEGVAQANNILNLGLTPAVIQFKSLEAFQQLSRSNNSKIIITDGKTPFLISGDQ
jgi:prohibitin 1